MARAAPTNAADATRTKQARIERLRRRLETVQQRHHDGALVSILKGMLDLLEDEL